jgi:hypothetical protein
MRPSKGFTNVEESPFYESFMKMHAGLIDAVKNYDGFESYAEKIEKWDKTKIMTQYIDIEQPMKCGFVVMNHGDPWLNNMMFKADADNKSIDCKLIDFQLTFWASPAADLLYFLISSVENDIKVDHFDDFIEFYHTELSSGLKKLGYEQYIPTLGELHVDLLEKGFFGEFRSFEYFEGHDRSLFASSACFCLMVTLFIVKYDSPEEMNMEIFMGEGGNPELLKRAYGNECYKAALKLWLPFMNKRGFLDGLVKK